MVFKIMCFKVFSNFPISFNGFQIMCFTKLCVYIVFSNFPIGFKELSNYVLQNVLKCPIGFNGFQIMCFKIFHRFQWFSNCVSNCFRISP